MNLKIKHLLGRYSAHKTDPRELVDMLSARIKKAPQEIWISLTPEHILEKILERLDRISPDALPLYGIPFAIKDNIDLEGVPSTAACPSFAYVPQKSAKVVELLIEAGAIPMGKTNMDQFATGLVGVRSPYGVVPNKINGKYICGGSSSGSAAALAYGLCSFSLGTDTAGSGRVPAAFNELVGVKPSRGVLSMTGVVPACKSLDCVSIFAKDVEDAAAVFEIAQKPDSQDPYSRTLSKNFTPLKAHFTFGIPRKDQLEFFGNAEYKKAFADAVKKLKHMGGSAVEIDFQPFLDAAKLLYGGPWVYERYASVGGFIKANPDAVLPVISEIITPKIEMHPSDVFRGMYKLQELKRKADAEFEKADVLLTPTTGTIYTVREIAENPIALNANLGYYTNYMNLLDYCAIALPMERAGNLPFGITMTGKTFTDKMLLDVAMRMDEMDDEYEIAVCGAHLKGEQLHRELEKLDAAFVMSARTSPKYKMYAFENGGIKKPALIRCNSGGAECYIEVYRIDAKKFAEFVASIPSPLAVGKIELQDGSFISGFVGEAEIADYGKDISDIADWRKYDERK